MVSSILNACMKKEETINAFPWQIFQKTNIHELNTRVGIKVSDSTDKYLFFLKSRTAGYMKLLNKS